MISEENGKEATKKHRPKQLQLHCIALHYYYYYLQILNFSITFIVEKAKEFDLNISSHIKMASFSATELLA